MCLATDTLKCGFIQKKETALNGYHLHRFLTPVMTLKRALYTICFYHTFQITALLGTNTKDLEKI